VASVASIASVTHFLGYLLLFYALLLVPTSKINIQRMVRSLTPTQGWRKKQLMDSGAFLSKKLTYSNRNQRRQVHRLLTTCHQKFIENYLELQFKQSYVNPVKNTLDAPSSENIYFGKNLKAIEENQVSRPSYGVGSGSQTIGTDKREHKIHHMFPQLDI
jgi:hypothetical protein